MSCMDFANAAYAAFAYICISSDLAHFVASKTRVAPFNQLTIPWLEFLSCLLLASHVFEALKIVTDVEVASCFTDSIVALYILDMR